MRRSWVLEVNGRRCRLDAEWDLVATSRGRAWVDGVEAARWWPGVKLRGVTATVPVLGASVCLIADTWGKFDIDLSRSPGVRSVDPPLPADYSPGITPVSPARVRALVLLGLALLLLLVGAGVALLVLSSLGFLR